MKRKDFALLLDIRAIARHSRYCPTFAPFPDIRVYKIAMAKGKSARQSLLGA